MKLPRRQFLRGPSAVALPAVPQIATAHAYPTRPAHWIVAAAGGSALDIFARLIGRWLSERLGQPFVIETGRVAAAISALRLSLTHHRTATHSFYHFRQLDQCNAL